VYQVVRSAGPLPHPAWCSKIVGLSPVYLDIETTGLDPFRARVIAVGLLYADARDGVLEQWFAESPVEEGQLLRSVAERVRCFSGVVTFNGTQFDLPFLQVRAARHGLMWSSLPHVDLLPEVRRRLAGLGPLPDCRLHTVLGCVGVPLEKPSSGAAVPRVYRRWLQTRDPADRAWILAHNAQDLAGLPALATRLGHLPSARPAPPGRRVGAAGPQGAARTGGWNDEGRAHPSESPG